MESLNSKITDLMTTLAAVKEATLLNDNEVRQTLSNLSQWESSLKEIKQGNDKIDKDSIKATFDDAEIVKICLRQIVQSLWRSKNGFNNCRQRSSIILLGQECKRHCFKQEMLDALGTNQISEKDKVKVLRKYLKGAPRESVGENTTVKSVD